jgi:hypothetical protein
VHRAFWNAIYARTTVFVIIIIIIIIVIVIVVVVVVINTLFLGAD